MGTIVQGATKKTGTTLSEKPAEGPGLERRCNTVTAVILWLEVMDTFPVT